MKAVLSNFSNAFTKVSDTVYHETLLDKQHKYGIRGQANNHFKFYLSNRTQYI